MARKKTTESVIALAKVIHSNKYDYSKFIYKTGKEKVTIICPIHGEFKQSPDNHINKKQGCPKCHLDNRKEKDKIYYETKICPICGKEFTRKIKYNSKHCSYECANKAKMINKREVRSCKMCGTEFIERIKRDRNFCSDECRVNWGKLPENISSKFSTLKKTMLSKYGVDHSSKITEVFNRQIETRKKTYELNKDIIDEKVRNTKIKKYNDPNFNNHDLISKTKLERHGDVNYNNREKFKKTVNDKLKNRLNNIGYELLDIDDNGLVKIKHPDGHIFDIMRGLLITRLCENREISTKHLPYDPSISNYEIEISKFLLENNIPYIGSDKTLIKPLELDFYIPDHKIAIEFDGLYWHSEYYRPNNYHLNKYDKCNKNNVKLIHIFEDEWVHKKHIVKSVLLQNFKKNNNKIFARNTTISEIDNKTYFNFLNENHILGKTNSSIKIGLFHNGELCSVMGLKKENSDSEYNLNRFCSKINLNVIGGASKLLSYFIKQYNPNKIITFSDKRYSNGELYDKLGFSFVCDIKPTYWYVEYRKIIRHHKFSFIKNKICGDINDNRSEHEIMLENKIPRIYDCGLMKFELIINKKEDI